LEQFLASGPPLIYIGFSSIVIDDPDKLTVTILDAVRAIGTRAIVSRGWSKLGGDSAGDDQVFFLGDYPHEWLFQHITAGNMVHAGGAGPDPIPFKALNNSNLAEAILFCLTPEASAAA
ncbi:unnamed protein product, partial [Fusarium graminearum]